MHVSVTRTTDPRVGPTSDATIVGEEMVPWLEQIDGFEGLLLLSNQEAGTTIVLTFWESRDVAERHGEARAAFRDRVTAAVRVQVEDVTGYEVTFAHLDALEIASDSFPRPARLPEATGGGETAG